MMFIGISNLIFIVELLIFVVQCARKRKSAEPAVPVPVQVPVVSQKPESVAKSTTKFPSTVKPTETAVAVEKKDNDDELKEKEVEKEKTTEVKEKTTEVKERTEKKQISVKKDDVSISKKKEEEKEKEKSKMKSKEESKRPLKTESKEPSKRPSKGSKEPYIILDPPGPLNFKQESTSQVRLTLKNIHDKEVMFKIKFSGKAYQVNPVFGRIEPGKTVDVTITHNKSKSKEAKMVIVNTEYTDEPDLAKSFQKVTTTGGEVTLKLLAT